MADLQWKDEYRLGIEFLDFEHKDLFDRVNDLSAYCTAETDPELVADCLGRLHARLAAHFALEEKTMLQRSNPHYPAHKAEHDAFLDEVTEAIGRFGSGIDEPDVEALVERINVWIVGHITTYDRRLVEGKK